MIDLRTIHNTTWLAEPIALRRAVARVAAYRGCYSARELARERRRQWERWIASAERQGIASTGITDTAERELAAGGKAPKAVRAVKGRVGVIPVHGPLAQHMTSELMKADGTSCDFVSRALDALLADEGIGAIVLHCDSPGGYAFGIQELSDKIYSARAQKPIYAMADSMACSAAYWLASAAGVFCCTPGGEVGSVGVYAVHVDESLANELMGLNVSLIRAGKYKAEWGPWAPLSDDARAALQEAVDADYARFVDAVKRNRDTSADDVKANYGQGRALAAPDALAAGMIDRVMTFEALMAKLTGTPGPGAGSQASARASERASTDMLRLRQAHRKRVG